MQPPPPYGRLNDRPRHGGHAIRIATLNTTGRQLAVATIGLLVLGATFTPETGRTVEKAVPDAPEIACGGYAEDGELLRPEAVSVTHADVIDGRLAVPATCGGYTEDGEFIGDD